ncbi:hypothetical protein HYPSUDRAFT_597907, partial [Hypholoma sublateritium FD-334 SS-4]
SVFGWIPTKSPHISFLLLLFQFFLASFLSLEIRGVCARDLRLEYIAYGPAIVEENPGTIAIQPAQFCQMSQGAVPGPSVSSSQLRFFPESWRQSSRALLTSFNRTCLEQLINC